MTFFRIFLLLALPYFACSQVNLYFNKTVGIFDKNTLTNVDVGHFHRVELDVIYHAKVLSEKQNVLYEVQSGIIRTHDFGRKKLDVYGPKGFQTLVKDVDLSSYSGKIYLMAELLHPLDRSSVICRIEDSLYLDKGVLCGLDKTPRTHPDSLEATWLLGYQAKPFVLDSMFKIRFDNKNPVPMRETYRFVVEDEEKTRLYEVELNDIEIPVGVSFLTEKQLGKLQVLKDDFENRNPTSDLRLQLNKGEHKYAESRYISRFQHSEQSTEMVYYHNRVTNCAWKFIENADIHPNTVVPDQLYFRFDQLGKLQNGQAEGVLGLRLDADNPYSVQLGRSDVNASVRISQFWASNFVEAEQKALLKGTLGNLEVEIQEKTMSEFVLRFPKQLFLEKTIEMDDRTVSTKRSAVQILHRGFLIEAIVLFDGFNKDQATIDPNPLDLLNSIEINGHRLQFEVNKSGIVQSVSLEKGIYTKELPEKEWRHRLLAFNKLVLDRREKAIDDFQERKEHVLGGKDVFSYETAPFPLANVVVEGGRDTRIFKKKTLDSLGISFLYREQKGLKEKALPSQDMKLILNDTMGMFGQVFEGGHSTFGRYKGDTSHQRVQLNRYEFGKYRYKIEIDNYCFLDAPDLRTVRSLAGQVTTKIQEQRTGDWQFVFQKKNERRGQDAFFSFAAVRSENVYLVRFYSAMQMDLEHFLNHLTLEGQGFDFSFDEEGDLVGFNIKH